VDTKLDLRHAKARSAVSILVSMAGLLLAGCSSGPSLAQRQADVIQQIQKVTEDVNPVTLAQGEYAEGVSRPCPANLTPGTFPGYDCTNSGFTPKEARQAMDAISRAKSRLAADEAKCVLAVANLHGARVHGVVVKKAYCLPTVPPPA
jgi:hypothetical protein